MLQSISATHYRDVFTVASMGMDYIFEFTMMVSIGNFRG